MNSKIIAIIAVVALCGAALVGVGYAYSVTMTNNSNSITSVSEYTTVSVGGADVKLIDFADVGIEYNTVSACDGNVTEYTPVNNMITETKGVNLAVTNTNMNQSYNKVEVEVELPEITTYNGTDPITGTNITSIKLSVSAGDVTGYSISSNNSFPNSWTIDFSINA